MSLDEYAAKRKERQYQEAKDFVVRWIQRYGHIPQKDDLHEYFFLFTKDHVDLTEYLTKKMQLCGNYDLSINFLVNHKPMFENFDAFIQSCIGNNE